MSKDLESLFRSSFNDENISEEDWNVPPDKVWAGIEEDLTEKKKKRFAFFWVFPFAVMGGLFALFLFSEKVFFDNKNNQNMPTINAKNIDKTTIRSIDDTETIGKNTNGLIKNVIFENKNTENNNVENTENQSAKNNVAGKKAIFDKKYSNPQKPTMVGSFTKKSIATTNANQSFLVGNKNSNLVLSNVVENINASIVSNNEKTDNSEIVQNTNQKRSPLETIKSLPQDFKYLAIPELSVNIASIYASKLDYFSLEKIKPTPNYAVIVSAQTFFVKNKIKSDGKIDFSGEKFNLAYSYGISASRMIGKRTFVTLGLQQSEIRYALNYDVALPFNPNGETTNINGNFDNKYNGAIPTSQGELKMEMVLQRQSNQVVTAGEAIPISASGIEKLKFVRIPLSIGANFFNIGKFQIINQLSFNQMINTSTETTFQSVLSRHSAVKETQTTVQNSPKPNRWTPEIGTILGFYYPLTKKMQLGAEGFFNQSLRPMYKNASYSNTPISYGIGVNLKYRF